MATTTHQGSQFVIWPYYTGRDKGCITTGCDCGQPGGRHVLPNRERTTGCATYFARPLLFDTEEAAWAWAAEHASFPSEVRYHNRVVTLDYYREN